MVQVHFTPGFKDPIDPKKIEQMKNLHDFLHDNK